MAVTCTRVQVNTRGYHPRDMCGRFSQGEPAHRISDYFGAYPDEDLPDGLFNVPPTETIRVIVVGGGAQVAQVALGAVSEADRHNLRGERISVDTIALVGEENIAAAVRAVADLPRARCLVLAGSIMGGDITTAVRELREHGVPVIALNMAGSVTDAADLVVSDPVQAGTMAVMAIADTAQFDLARQRGRRY